MSISTLREKDVNNYPFKALRELVMNAVMHRDYQSNMPTRLYQYDTHIEVMNPGGLYGEARPENFPNVNDYRNGVVAEMMKTLNYVNMFNHGVGEVQDLLRANNSPKAEFNVSYLTAFSVVVKEPNETSLPILAQMDEKVDITDNNGVIIEISQFLSQACPKLSQAQYSKIVEVLKSSASGDPKSAVELMNEIGETNRSRFRNNILDTLVTLKMMSPLYQDNPRHPKQKYILTDLGKQWIHKLHSA